jgi:hypothetical protein
MLGPKVRMLGRAHAQNILQGEDVGSEWEET